MSKTSLYIAIGLIAAFSACAFELAYKLKKENLKLFQNQEILLAEKDVLSKEKSILQLDNKSLKIFLDSNKTYKDMIEDSLKIKNKRIQSLTLQLANVKIDTVTSVRDSLIYIQDTIPIIAKYAEIKDNYINASVIISDHAKWHIEHNDTIAVVIHDKAKFFKRLFGKHQYVGSVINRSPYGSVYLDKVITKSK